MVAAVASKSPDPVDLHTQLSAGRDDNKDESSPGGQDLRGEDARQHPLIWRGTKIREEIWAARTGRATRGTTAALTDPSARLARTSTHAH